MDGFWTFMAGLCALLVVILAIVVSSEGSDTAPAKIRAGTEKIMSPTESSETRCKTKVWIGAARHYGARKLTRQYRGDLGSGTVFIGRDGKKVSWETHGYAVVGLWFWRSGTDSEEPLRRSRSELSAEHVVRKADINLASAGPFGGSITTVQLCLEKERG